MARFFYRVEFQDDRFPPDDQDFLWGACFIVVARDGAAARDWGDYLARQQAVRMGQLFVSSIVETVESAPPPGPDDRTPTVHDSEEATPEYIGW